MSWRLELFSSELGTTIVFMSDPLWFSSMGLTETRTETDSCPDFMFMPHRDLDLDLDDGG